MIFEILVLHAVQPPGEAFTPSKFHLIISLFNRLHNSCKTSFSSNSQQLGNSISSAQILVTQAFRLTNIKEMISYLTGNAFRVYCKCQSVNAA
jgi:hypothetical protein